MIDFFKGGTDVVLEIALLSITKGIQTILTCK